MPRSVADALGAYMKTVEDGSGALLFPNEVGGYLRPKWKPRVFDRAAALAKLTPPALRVHDLRHTAASLWIASGASVKVVQQQLGHKTASMTLDVYGHLLPDELDTQAERLDALRSTAPADSARIPNGGGEVVALANRL
jgi:integrase